MPVTLAEVKTRLTLERLAEVERQAAEIKARLELARQMEVFEEILQDDHEVFKGLAKS